MALISMLNDKIVLMQAPKMIVLTCHGLTFYCGFRTADILFSIQLPSDMKPSIR